MYINTAKVTLFSVFHCFCLSKTLSLGPKTLPHKVECLKCWIGMECWKLLCVQMKCVYASNFGWTKLFLFPFVYRFILNFFSSFLNVFFFIFFVFTFSFNKNIHKKFSFETINIVFCLNNKYCETWISKAKINVRSESAPLIYTILNGCELFDFLNFFHVFNSLGFNTLSSDFEMTSLDTRWFKIYFWLSSAIFSPCSWIVIGIALQTLY